MTRESRWEAEWEVLRAERELARRRWRSAADGLAARAADPLGIGRILHAHPVAATGIGAVVGTILAKLLLGGARAPADGPADRDAPARPAAAWPAVLRDAAISIAVPWLLAFLKEKFGWDLGPAAAPEPNRPAPATADAAAPSVRT